MEKKDQEQTAYCIKRVNTQLATSLQHTYTHSNFGDNLLLDIPSKLELHVCLFLSLIFS